MILGDFHTHTYFSHGKGTIEQNVLAAEQKGLKQIAITDHGFKHIAFGMRPSDMFKMKKFIEESQKKHPSVKILHGIEANIQTSDGALDLKEHEREQFDVVLAGFHKGVWAKNFKEYFHYYLRCYRGELFGFSAYDKKVFTRAMVKAICSEKFNILTHLNYGICSDVVEVAKAAIDHNVLIELNGKRMTMSDDEISKIASMGVKFVVNSDAHTPNRVGDFALPLSVAERIGLDKKSIANWDVLPKFN